MAPDAIVEAREYIAKLGEQYLPEKANEYTGKGGAGAGRARSDSADQRGLYAGVDTREYLSEEQYPAVQDDLAAVRVHRR